MWAKKQHSYYSVVETVKWKVFLNKVFYLVFTRTVASGR
jgi:hypothetical protein